MDGYLTADEIAERLGVKPRTVHQYKARGDMPSPDEYASRTPLWAEDTIEHWLASRPGHGWRRGSARAPEPT